MAIPEGSVRREHLIGVVKRAALPAFAIWLLIILGRGLGLAAEPFTLPFLSAGARSYASIDQAVVCIGVLVICLMVGATTHILAPQYTMLSMIAAGTTITVTAAAMSGSCSAVAVVLAITLGAIASGCGLLLLVSQEIQLHLTVLPLAFAAGLGLLAVAWLVLATAEILNPVTVTLVTGVAVALAIRATRRQIRGDINLSIRNQQLSWIDLVIAGVTVGLITFGSLAAFTPELHVDATRQHLPIAREIWETGTVAAFDPMSVSRLAVQGHVLSAVAFGGGGATAAKLLQVAIGIGCISSVAGLAAQLGGFRAGLYSAATFGTMPIVLWESGRALVDLLPVLFTVCAVWCAIQWQEQDRASWLVLSGALTSIGVTAKANMVLVALALGFTIFVVGRAPFRLGERLQACCYVALGSAAMLPWLLRTYSVNGEIPGLGIVRGLFTHVAAPPTLGVVHVAAQDAATPVPPTPTPISGQSQASQQFGHAPLDFVGLPWFLTFHSRDLGFPSVGRGEVGVALLAFLPSWLFVRWNRALVFLMVFSITSYAAWWATPFQIARHLLPTLAIASALCGVSLTSLMTEPRSDRAINVIRIALPLAVMCCLLVVPFLYLTSPRTQVPIEVITGRISDDNYIRENVHSGTPLLASAAYLTPDEPLLYIGGPIEAPQIYTPARLIFFPSDGAGVEALVVLDTFKQLGVRHFLWNRADSGYSGWHSYMLSTPFLRQYTRILAGDDDAYLFEVLPAGDTTWGQPEVTNLLEDPGLQEVKGKKSPWVTDGKSVIATGVVALSRRATLTQEVAITPGHAYLLEAPIRCLDPSGRGILTFRWLDAAGTVIDTESEEVLPGREVSDQFLWRRAPEEAARVQAEFSMAGPSRCEFSGAALYDLG